MSFLTIKLFLVLAPLLVSFIGVGVSCYVACRDLDVVLSTFKSSYAIAYYGRMPPGKWTFATRFSLTSKLSGIIAWSSRYIRNGMLDSEEFACLPRAIRRRMKWSAGLTISGFVGPCVVFVVLEIFKWRAM
jgi:hypothetical protein